MHTQKTSKYRSNEASSQIIIPKLISIPDYKEYLQVFRVSQSVLYVKTISSNKNKSG